MSKRSSGASEIHGFISVNNDKSSKSSKPVKNVTRSVRTVAGTTSKTVIKSSSKSEHPEDPKKKTEPQSNKSKVIDVKITRKSDAKASPRPSQPAVKSVTSRTSNVTSKSSSSTKALAVSSKPQTTSPKSLSTTVASSQKNKTSTSKVSSVSSKTSTTRTSSNALNTPKTEVVRKTTVSNLKTKPTSREPVKRISPATKTSKPNPDIKLEKAPTIKKRENPKNQPIKPEVLIETSQIPEKIHGVKSQETIAPLPGLKREGTWVKEDFDKVKSKKESDDNIGKDKESEKKEADEVKVKEDSYGSEGSHHKEEVTASEGETSSQLSPSEDEPYYEDDFEDYESDFEEYESEESGVNSSGTESESSGSSVSSSISSQLSSASEQSHPTNNRPDDKKLDSGNYDMRRSRTGFYHPPPTSQSVREESVSKEKRPVQENTFYSQQSIQWKPVTSQTKVQRRGEKLLQMIKLDVTSISLLTMAPIPYDIFIKVYGKKNTTQRSVQTNEECVHQEVQTDEIKHKDKWTQFPVKYHNWNKSDVDHSLTQFYKDRVGVGDDNPVSCALDSKLSYDMAKLNRFLDYAADVMVVSLEESGLVEQGGASAVKSDLVLSQGCLLIRGSNQDLLRGRNPSLLTFSPHNPNYILVVYHPKQQQDEELVESRCLICLWNVLGGDAPPKSCLVSPADVTSVAFDALHPHIIYAGLIDGGICVWELRDRGIRLNTCWTQYQVRAPVYSTCGVMGGEGHYSAVISVQSLAWQQTKSSHHFTPRQLASVEEVGKVMLWSVVARKGWDSLVDGSVSGDLGAAPWATLALTPSLSLTPFHQTPRSMELRGWSGEDDDVTCTCMVAWPGGGSSVLVGSDQGRVALCSLLVIQPAISFYNHNHSFEKPSVTCIQVSPINPQLFMVGLSSGVVRLHVVGRTRALRILSWGLGQLMPPISSLALSTQRPGLLFASHSNSTMYVWNICESDIVPLFPVTFKDVDLSTTALTTNGKSSYLAVAGKDCVQVHKIKKEFTTTNHLEQKIFSTYLTLV